MNGLRRYEMSDLPMLNGWYRAHRMTEARHEALPAVGFVVPGVAAGFVYQTDSALALIDGFVTNPEAMPEVRNEALDAITQALELAAREAGFAMLAATTNRPEILRRAVQHGFDHLGHYAFLAKELK